MNDLKYILHKAQLVEVIMRRIAPSKAKTDIRRELADIKAICKGTYEQRAARQITRIIKKIAHLA